MLGKRPRPVIGKLTALLVSGNRAGFLDVGTSPRSPLDLKIQSPRGGLKNYDLGGVGLGIVVALEKSSSRNSGCDGDSDSVAKHAICSSSSLKSNRSSPIPVNSGKICNRYRNEEEEEDLEMEDYTYVTCHHGPNKSFTKVYYDGVERERRCVVTQPPPPPTPLPRRSTLKFVDEEEAYPTSDFLNSCDLCRKKLHGKDIYIYRGEKAFCSSECRSRQIMIDERKEQQCRSADLSSSPYTRDQIFSTGVLAI